MSIFQFFQPHFPAKIPSIFPPSKSPSHFSADFLNASGLPERCPAGCLRKEFYAWKALGNNDLQSCMPAATILYGVERFLHASTLIRLPAAWATVAGSSPHGLSSHRPLLRNSIRKAIFELQFRIRTNIVRIHIKSKLNRPNFGVHFLVQFIARENRCSAQYSHDLLAR